MIRSSRLILTLAIVAAPIGASAQESVELLIRNHRFEPAELHVPAGKKVRILVKNQDPESEEFESDDLNREKIIKGNSEAEIFVGPLDKGRYTFYGEFNQDTAQGVVVAE